MNYTSKQAVTTKKNARIQCTHLARDSVEQAVTNTGMDLGVPQFLEQTLE
jgi:NifU-like protein involved in Fe-S cluster formation